MNDKNNNLSEKTIVVTGATSGIGYATAEKLAGLGVYTIGVGRNIEKCENAKQSILSKYPEAKIVYQIADLASFRQINRLANNISKCIKKDDKEGIDGLINVAGTFSSWFTLTENGIETQFAVNHLAPFLLTNKLLDLLMAVPESRIITVSSKSHFRTRINWKDIQLRKHYNSLRAYKQTKLANILFTTELRRRLGEDATIKVFAADPGLVNTDIGFKKTHDLAKYIWKVRKQKGVVPDEAASAIVYLATEESIKNSKEIYWKNCKPITPSKYSLREDIAKRMWELSERMCGIKYNSCNVQE